MPRAARLLWANHPLGAVAAREPFGNLEKIADGAWALVSTPLSGDRTTLSNGGFIAGRRRLDTPMMHGALVGATAYVVIAAFATTITVVAGHGAPGVPQVIFAILWLALGGTIGGWVASWRAQRSRPSSSSS